MAAVQNHRIRLRVAAVGVLAGSLLASGLGTGLGTGTAQAAVPLDGAPDQAAADVLHVARNQVGDDYVWGGNGPAGWDCSGLTSLWRTVGGAAGMPRVSAQQQAWTIPIPQEQAKKGDLVFFGNPVSHAGIVSGGGYMVDAAQSRKGVVQRLIWNSGVVRYGRVPRPGMPKVQPWTPSPLPSAEPTAPVADVPPAVPRAARDRPVTAPAAAPRPPASGSGRVRALAGLPTKPAAPSRTGAKLAANAKTVIGRPVGPRGWSDTALVRTAWRHAGGKALPQDRAALVRRGKPVAKSAVRVGDLVVYASPDVPHVAVYTGHGYMVSASPRYGKVVLRRVYDAPSVRFVRLG